MKPAFVHQTLIDLDLQIGIDEGDVGVHDELRILEDIFRLNTTLRGRLLTRLLYINIPEH